MIRKLLFCSAFAAVTLCAADIHVAGDSIYAPQKAPGMGIGDAIKLFCKPDVKVFNRAVGGRSTKSFINEGRWKKLMAVVKPGDYVFIQFGHNDQKKYDKKRYADPATDYRVYLKKMITDIRAQKANPVLITSIVRCRFAKGKLRDTGLYPYRNAVFAVAAEEKVPVVNMNGITEEKINAVGEEAALKWFMFSTDDPRAKGRDRTHTTIDGAKVFASWLVNDCKKQNLPVVECFK